MNYQYNYSYGGSDCPQHRQLHCIWETNEEGELLINRNMNVAANTDTQSITLRPMFLDVYLPNGLLLPIQCPAQRTLGLLKQDVFIQARRYPMSNRLMDISNYVFTTIGLDGTHIELYDEQKTVSSLQFLFLPLLVLVEPEGNKMEKELNQNIGLVMGIQLSELEHWMNEELHQYRLRLFETCIEAEQQRGTKSFGHYAFPEEPLLAEHPNAEQNERLFNTDELNEAHLDYAQFPDQPEKIECRALEILQNKMQNSGAYIEVWYDKGSNADEVDCERFKYYVKIRNKLNMTPEDVVQMALKELQSQYGLDIPQQPSDFILQIVGKRVFVTRRNVYLTQFDYIRSCFENYRIPRLILRLKKHVFCDYPSPPKIFEPSYVRRERHNHYFKSESTGFFNSSDNISSANFSSAEQQQQIRPFWDLDENLKVRILSASNITVQDGADRLFIRVAMAVGRHILDVKDSTVVAPSNPRWQDGSIEFDVYLKDLPESAQLCFSLISINSSQVDSQKKQRGSAGSRCSVEHLFPLGWANFRVFDWRNRLHQGKQTLFLRPFDKDHMRLSKERSFKFIHSVECPDSSQFHSTSNHRTPRLEIEMPEYFGQSVIIQFPSDSVIRQFIDWIRQQRRQRYSSTDEGDEMDDEYEIEYDSDIGRQRKSKSKFVSGNPDLDRLLQLRRCLDSLYLSKDNQLFLWRFRFKIRRLFPQMLPILADCAFIWRDRETTSEFYKLLMDWPALKVDTAIELLDGRYVDRRLRAMAVQHLDNALNNDHLQLYLLILVQAIRFEPHAYSPLVKMLLTRALMDYRVGHTLFWLIRAELAHLLTSDQNLIGGMNSAPLSPLFIRFALLLEAYCRGNIAHLPSMIKQVEMISILTSLSAIVRTSGNKEATNKKLQQELLVRKEQMQNMVSPVNATDQLGELIVEECRVLSSAKQPLLLTWRNPEYLAELETPTQQLIFKCGDDMRQDMLTLHVMRIMDAKWKCQLQQNYCMTLYEVLPMGKNIGLIHVVPDCQTLFQIQCDAKRKYAGTSLNMDVDLLNKHIYEKCCANDSKKYLQCVDRFTYSLAGYCIATYILGIKDRHQDNIMLTKDGRLFHIDFGHFLGHTKRKLGINRERTDFILTNHFLCVISRGKTTNFRQSYEYTSFREDCTKGFLVLHNQARFFIALFRMMCCMGLPELNSPENIEFLRQSLMYDKTDRDEARAAFQQIFEDVVKADWSVQLNWFFHSVRHM